MLKRLAESIRQRLAERNRISRRFFASNAEPLAAASARMAERFQAGGRLLAIGQGPYATDAQHVAVEFIHPVLVGKRALPALDLSSLLSRWSGSMAGPEDIVMGFGPPEGDAQIQNAMDQAGRAGAMVLALPGSGGDYRLEPPTSHPFIYQEILEILYHTLWETVHVFLEHGKLESEAGAAGFLYPFLESGADLSGDPTTEAARSISSKAREDERLREEMAAGQAELLGEISLFLHRRISAGGKLILFGNGGSATDANDLAIDCTAPPLGYQPIPAVSLCVEPATITAIANDVGSDLIFLRQLVAHANRRDIAWAISTSGASPSIVMALEEARRRNLTTLALVGSGGGEIVQRGLADMTVVVPCDYIPRIQEVQASLYHVVRETIEEISRA